MIVVKFLKIMLFFILSPRIRIFSMDPDPGSQKSPDLDPHHCPPQIKNTSAYYYVHYTCERIFSITPTVWFDVDYACEGIFAIWKWCICRF